MVDTPDQLRYDEVINQYSLIEVSNLFAQFKMIIAMEKQTALQERSVRAKGVTKKDQEVKTIRMAEAEDNATTKLCSQRYLF